MSTSGSKMNLFRCRAPLRRCLAAQKKRNLTTISQTPSPFTTPSGTPIPVSLHPLTPIIPLTSKIHINDVPKIVDKQNMYWKTKHVHAFLRSFETGSHIGLLELDRSVFGETLRQDIMRRALAYEQSWRESGTRHTPALGEMPGSGRKIYAQKGSGRARHGHRYAPQFVGGYKAHGPKPHDRTIDINRKFYAKAVRSALSTKFAQDQLTIVDSFSSLESLSKEDFISQKLAALSLAGKKSYFMYGSSDDTTASDLIRILDSFETRRPTLQQPMWEHKMLVSAARHVSVAPVLEFEHLVLDKAALEVLEEMYHLD